MPERTDTDSQIPEMVEFAELTESNIFLLKKIEHE